MSTGIQILNHYPIFDLIKYFGVNTSADVPWGHAINSREKLELALQSGNVMIGACMNDPNFMVYFL